MRMDLVFFTRVPIDLNGEKIFFRTLFFLVLLFQEVEKGYVPKFGVPIFNLARSCYKTLKWPHYRSVLPYIANSLSQ